METQKDLPCNEKRVNKNVPLCCLFREIGAKRTSGPPKGLQWAAEEKLINKDHEEFECSLPEGTRSTFLMVFSPDGKMVASTHGNHNVYVTDFTNGRNVKTLIGHPRTPWCIAFHPSSNQILASGCLGGQVRVWDLHGGSEIWTAESQTVIASLAFHPTDRVLVIASYNEIHFWDWSQQMPFAKCCTSNEREKVRYVGFAEGGGKLVTGIANAPARPASQWDRVSAPQPPPQFAQSEHERRITICYRYMVEQYQQLIDRYYRLTTNPSPRSSATTTMDRGTDPMEPTEETTPSRCAICRRSNFNDGNEAGPSTADLGHRHFTGTDEVSASHSSSQFMRERNIDSMQPRANYLFERLARLRTQVETGRSILAQTRTAVAALSSRMSPSAPEDANFLIDRGEGTRMESGVMLPEPLLPNQQDRPSFISRIGSYLSRRRNGSRPSDSSSSDTSDWQRPLTPPPSHSQRITNLNPPHPRRIIYCDPDITSNRRPWAPCITPPPINVTNNVSGSLSLSEPTNGSDSESDPHNLIIRQNADHFSHWRVFLRYRYFRDSGSNTEPPSESNSSDSNSSRFRRNSETIPTVRLRPQIRRLPSSHNAREREHQVLREAAATAERNLFSRLSNLLEQPLPSTSSSPESPEGNSAELASVRYGIQVLGRHINNLSNQCSRVSLESGEMRRMWEELESQIFTIQGAIREWPRGTAASAGAPTVSTSTTTTATRVSPPAEADAVASTSSLPTDEESEDSGLSLNGRRQLGPRRFRFLHRPAYKRPRFDRHLRLPRRLTQETSADDDSDDDGSLSRQSGNSDADSRGVKRKSLCDPSPPTPPAPPAQSHSNHETPRGICRNAGAGRARLLGRHHRFRPPFSMKNLNIPPLRDRTSGTGRELSAFNRDVRDCVDEHGALRSRSAINAINNSRESVRHRARNVLLLMVDSLTQFFENDTLTRSFPNENLQERITNLIGLLELALNLTDLLLSQLYSSSRDRVEPLRDQPPSVSYRVEAQRDRSITVINPNYPNGNNNGEIGNRRESVTRGESVSRVGSRTRSMSGTGTGGASGTGGTSGGTGVESGNSSETSGSRYIPQPVLVPESTSRSEPGGVGQRERRFPPYIFHRQTVRDDIQRRRPSSIRRFMDFDDLWHPFPLREEDTSSQSGNRLPVLRVNGGPVPPDTPSSTLRESPPYRYHQQRFLHPRYRLPLFPDDSSEESSHDRNDLYYFRAHGSSGVFLSDTPMAPHHRIQAWDFSKYSLPDIHIADKNIVVAECKVHNDASVDISKDGKLLVTLLPSGRLCITTMIGVYSLEWESLGQCLYTYSFDLNAVSVSLSPTTRHLLVGLAARRVHFIHTDKQTFAQIFRLEGGKPSKSSPSKGRLVFVRDLETSREMSTDFMSLNCIRWAPMAGEAFVYGTNTGKLKILR